MKTRLITFLLLVAAAVLAPLSVRKQAIQGKLHHSTISADGRGGGASYEEHYNFSLDYPSEISVTKSFNVSLKYWISFDSVGRSGAPRELKFSLNSSAFNVSPGESILKPVRFVQEATGETADGSESGSVQWNLMPKQEALGTQQAFLVLEGVNFKEFAKEEEGNGFHYSLDSKVNGIDQTAELLDSGSLPIGIEVLSQYGVPAHVVWITQAILGIGGFIAVYPVVVKLLERRFTPKEDIATHD